MLLGTPFSSLAKTKLLAEDVVPPSMPSGTLGVVVEQ